MHSVEILVCLTAAFYLIAHNPHFRSHDPDLTAHVSNLTANHSLSAGHWGAVEYSRHRTHDWVQLLFPHLVAQTYDRGGYFTLRYDCTLGIFVEATKCARQSILVDISHFCTFPTWAYRLGSDAC